MSNSPAKSPEDSDATDADKHLIQEAIAQARLAMAAEETPIGCVIADASGAIMAAAFNQREALHDPTAHAEILALRAAAAKLKSWRLIGCTLAVTLEPCPMCAGAIVNARIGRVVYGCGDPKAGAARTLYRLCDDPRLNHRAVVVPNVLAEPCAALLREFFQAQRALGKK
jgi:tRNA(adenine34) deaminase